MSRHYTWGEDEKFKGREKGIHGRAKHRHKIPSLPHGCIITTGSSCSPNYERKSGSPELKSGTSPVAEWVTLNLHWTVDLPKLLITEPRTNNARWTAENTTTMADTISLLSCRWRVQSRSGILTSAHTHMQKNAHIHRLWISVRTGKR